MAIWIITEKCIGCGLCVKACPYGAVEVKDKKAVLNERCIACGACVTSCKKEAIATDAKEKKAPEGYSGVWVFAEQREGRIAKVSLELLGIANELSKCKGEEVAAVLLGSGVEGLASTLMAHGAAKVYLAQDKELADYRTGPYAKVISDLITARKPSIVLYGATHIGRDLAPRISRRLGVGLTADCTQLEMDAKSGNLQQTRPAFGDNVMATINSPYTRPQMATVRPGIMKAMAEDGKRKGEVIKVKPELSANDMMTAIIKKVKSQKAKVDLHAARIIVAGGRGVGSKEGFDMLRTLAETLGGELAGTRVVVEEGWLPQERQVGQTGQTVRPELYIACGISGAIQHKAGMMGSGTIVAINRDPDAPIFEVADIALIGDLKEIVPELIRQAKEARL